MFDAAVLGRARKQDPVALSRKLWSSVATQIESGNLPSSLNRRLVFDLVLRLSSSNSQWDEAELANYGVNNLYYVTFQRVATEVINEMASGFDGASNPQEDFPPAPPQQVESPQTTPMVTDIPSQMLLEISAWIPESVMGQAVDAIPDDIASRIPESIMLQIASSLKNQVGEENWERILELDSVHLSGYENLLPDAVFNQIHEQVPNQLWGDFNELVYRDLPKRIPNLDLQRIVVKLEEQLSEKITEPVLLDNLGRLFGGIVHGQTQEKILARIIREQLLKAREPEQSQIESNPEPQPEKALSTSTSFNPITAVTRIAKQNWSLQRQQQSSSSEIVSRQHSPVVEDLSQLVFNDDVIGDDTGDVLPLKIADRGEKVIFQWEAPADDKNWVYRVLLGEDTFYRPEPGNFLREIGRTTALSFSPVFETDSIPNRVAVWRYALQDGSVENVIPQLHAEANYILPPQEVETKPWEGQIGLSWKPLREGFTLIFAFKDFGEVRQLRRHGSDVLSETNPNFLQRLEGQHSFVHTGLPEGSHWYYVLINQAEVESLDGFGDSLLSNSSMVVTEATVPARLRPPELSAESESDETGDYIVASYDDVPGDVTLFMSSTPPNPVLFEKSRRGEMLSWDDAFAFGLNLDEKHSSAPERDENNRCWYRRLGWTINKDQLFLTPVACSGDKICVGRTEQVIRVFQIEDAKFIQHLTWQMITFKWPAGADFVDLFVFPHGVTPDLNSAPERRVSLDEYQKSGGIELEKSPNTPWDIYVRGVKTYKGKPHFGAPAFLQTEAIYPFSYAFYKVPKNLMEKFIGSGFLKNLVGQKETYELRMRYDGEEPFSASGIALQVFISERAVLCPNGTFNYGRAESLQLRRTLDKEDNTFYSEFPAPQLPPHAVCSIGYIEFDRELSEKEFTTMRVVPKGLDFDGMRVLALRRRNSRFLPMEGEQG